MAAVFSMMALPVPAQAASGATQFDIVCHLRGRLIVDHTADLNQPPGYLGPARWRDTLRYSVDLKRGIYADVGGKAPAAEKFARLTKSGIWFSKSGRGFTHFDLRTNRFHGRTKAGNWMTEIVSGPCRRVSSSGVLTAMKK
jgi:hypothetical protein